MYISYGNTDYRLFAKSEADDPNKYFLSDMAALELPLGQLLSSLRDVISDELSPLDELVMHVDGLGLEFSESSTADILEKFTFGDILDLYDRLVKNDGTEPSPDLYTYLMVRPSCRQRFIALRDSADSGRGLSEIAIYREETPIEGDLAGDFDSHSPYALPPSEDDEEAYEYEESGPAEDEADQGEADEAGEVENNNEPNSPSVHGSAIGTHTEDLAGEADAANATDAAAEADEANETGENADNNADASADATTADGLIDFSDDELDLSPTKQDQQENGSPHDPTNKGLNEHDALAAAEPSDPDQHPSPTNGRADAPSSDITSATATLNGDDKDEIDYSDDDGEDIVGGKDVTSNDGISVSGTLKVPINDEITWESENEDARDEPVTASKPTMSSVVVRHDFSELSNPIFSFSLFSPSDMQYIRTHH
ncbi:hypothetical protein F5Y00DRAFT_215662 [Daldinia vernicosa]|uniref:uncharacterized protein n=1 Tax=Daldinia vernicosa TaxID=114800 RepID=UPI0020071FA0|nr:uncharacterized protein F5Y00DRAFT_215662 [Daldinia vernicosa]KAI0851701.1 hypothetical protein F5Y00DRAFT_215662 [Daldinia vernicosa]